MTNRPPPITSKTPDLFQQLETEPTNPQPGRYYDLDVTDQLRGEVKQAMQLAERRHGMSRDRIVDELNLWLPNLATKITKQKINSWMATSKVDHPMPAYVLPALCMVLDSQLPVKALLTPIDLDVVDARERAALELGQTQIERAKLTRKVNHLQNQLKG